MRKKLRKVESMCRVTIQKCLLCIKMGHVEHGHLTVDDVTCHWILITAVHLLPVAMSPAMTFFGLWNLNAV